MRSNVGKMLFFLMSVQGGKAGEAISQFSVRLLRLRPERHAVQGFGFQLQFILNPAMLVGC